MATKWGKTKREQHTERRGLIPGAASIPNIEIVIKGRGKRWGWELLAGGGLTARCLYVHQTEAAALIDAERCGLALQAVER